MIDRPITILQVVPKLDTGGAERVVIEIADAIQASGHIALIACEAGGTLTPAALRTGAEIIHLPVASKSPFTLRRNARRLEALMRARGVQLVHAHSRAPAWSAFWATERAKIPFVTTYHGAYNENSALKRRYNSVMAKGDRVIAVSDFIAKLIRTRYGTPEEKLRTIQGGVDTAKFDAAAVLGDRVSRLAREWRVDMSQPTIMLPGRLTGWKGQKILITALARLRHRDAIAILAGSDQGRDNYTQNLISLAHSLGVADRLRLVGHNEDMPAAMMLADIVVNASTDPEAFGRTIIEAQSMGRITIATDHGGARETILPNETGFLVPPGDAAALALAIDTALDMPPEVRIAWGQNARAHVQQNYSIAAMQQAVLNVYAELLM
jgi:glycosyltransferase involved in cell wall biosynthesis